MKNFQIILHDGDTPDNVVWVRSEMNAEEIADLTGKFVSPLPDSFTEADGIDGEFPEDFPELINE